MVGSSMGARDFFEYSTMVMQEQDAYKRLIKQRIAGMARLLGEMSGPCRCSGIMKNSHLFHSFRKLETPLDEYIGRILTPYGDSAAIAVSAMGCISRFLEANGISLCRDQVYRLVAIAISVCAKFWDEGAVGEGVNLNFVSATGIPLEDYNAMEISFLSSLGWKLKMEEEEFDEWAGKIEMDGGAANEALTEAVEKVERLKRQASAAPTSPTGWAGVGDYPVKRLDSMSPHNSTLMADSLLSGKKVAHLMNAEPKLSPFNLMNGQPFQG